MVFYFHVKTVMFSFNNSFSNTIKVVAKKIKNITIYTYFSVVIQICVHKNAVMFPNNYAHVLFSVI